tara:strand:+ start:2126 stop:2677 length:552 start_codon:yes stop_codon:yes gene_type:complete
MTQPVVIIDRDGVINQDSDDYIKSVDEWIPIPGSIEAIVRLSQAGYLITVATNQSGIAREYFDDITLANIHSYMCSLVESAGGKIDAVFYCPHGPDEGCNCRKPLPGLLNQLENEFSLSVKNAYFIGDTEKDIDVALTKQCRPILVRTGKGALVEQSLDSDKKKQTVVVDDLLAASEYILSQA